MTVDEKMEDAVRRFRFALSMLVERGVDTRSEFSVDQILDNARDFGGQLQILAGLGHSGDPLHGSPAKQMAAVFLAARAMSWPSSAEQQTIFGKELERPDTDKLVAMAIFLSERYLGLAVSSEHIETPLKLELSQEQPILIPRFRR